MLSSSPRPRSLQAMATGAETTKLTASHHHANCSKWPDFSSQPETADGLRRLLELFASASFRTSGTEIPAQQLQDRCFLLFKLDHAESFLVNNSSGELSSGYPFSIIIPRNTDDQAPALESDGLRKMILKARAARCRARFPVPVILLDGAYICRSATLSSGVELIGRSSFDAFFYSNRDGQHSPTPALTSSQPTDLTSVNTDAPNSKSSTCPSSNSQPTSLNFSLSSLSINPPDGSQAFSNARTKDIKLLKALGVEAICDLMVEKKKVKYGVYISSSEKVDKENRYNEFTILSTPYPGCEFFKEFRDKGYTAEGLIFDWNQSYIDSLLDLPSELETLGALKNILWHDYKSWDLVQMTKNYLKLFLYYYLSSKTSLLIHCISGWDRTPLFVSLLRLSLWADGKIHQSLSAMEITFLTVAYDWYLFGHNLSDRLQKGEEILFFTFYFLQFITGEEFNVDYIREDIHRSTLAAKTSNSNGSSNASLEVLAPEDVTHRYNSHLGSCTSLNSNSSFASLKSQDSNPPSIFHCQAESVGQSSLLQGSYPGTPPTLTNSEEGGFIFESDTSETTTTTTTSTTTTPTATLAPTTTITTAPQATTTPNTNSVNGKECDDVVDGNKRKSPIRSHVMTSRTTPVPIPPNPTSTTSRRSSGRFDESWQFVSETGSIKDSPRAIHYSSPSSHESGASASHKRNSVSSETTLRTRKAAITRRENLQTVRSIFSNAYSAAIGYRLKNGENNLRIQPSGLSLLCQHLGVGNYTRVHAPQ